MELKQGWQRTPRDAVVLVRLAARTGEWAAYAASIDERIDDIESWYAHVVFETGAPSVVIVDRYGQVWFESETELPDAREIEEWTKFLATQCPECGVPDEPGYGEWEKEEARTA